MMALVLAMALAIAGSDPARDLALRLEGVWDNGAQVEADPARPHLHVGHIAFESGAADGALVYAELRVGGPQGELYRQRVYGLSALGASSGVRMAVYELAEPEQIAGADAARLSSLSYDDMVRFNPGCDFNWRPDGAVWIGEMRDGACRITSQRSGVDMIINAEFTIGDDRFTHSESGRNAETGVTIFEPPGGVPNIYDRVDQ